MRGIGAASIAVVVALACARPAAAQEIAATASPTAAAMASARASYPASWFAPLKEGDKPASWEITPDKAGLNEVILSKRTELGCFSNFAATPFELDGKRYASLEGLWQSLYYPEDDKDERAALGEWKHTRAEVEQMTAFTAKRAGDDAKKLLEKAGAPWIATAASASIRTGAPRTGGPASTSSSARRARRWTRTPP